MAETRFFALWIVLFTVGCTTTTVTVHSPLPGAQLVWDGVDEGVVPEGGLTIESPRGFGAVPWRLHTHQGSVDGVVERNRGDFLGFGTGALLLVGAAFLMPLTAYAAFLVANPAIVATATATTVGVPFETAALGHAIRPSVLTVPAVMTGTALPLTLLLPALWLATTESEVHLQLPDEAQP